jgi:hypothetical protein
VRPQEEEFKTPLKKWKGHVEGRFFFITGGPGGIQSRFFRVPVSASSRGFAWALLAKVVATEVPSDQWGSIGCV